MQSFGNLTLLTQPLNTAVSNGPYKDWTNDKGQSVKGKRTALQDHSLLVMNREITTQETWDEATIAARGESLFALAKTIWKLPVASVLHPDIRWYPGDEMLGSMGYAMLLPPLVYKVERARDPYALMKFDSSGRVSKGMFAEDWTRYVIKLATGAGKTKVMSLLMAWSYFHKLYEPDSDLSTNFLLIAPNIIVLDRLRTDFDGARIFYEDPLLPDNGYEGQNWQDDFQINVHIQDEIGLVEPQGNLFLTNIHRVYETGSEPAFEDENATDYFLGKKPVGKTTASQVDLGVIVREVPDLVVLNDEAHHLHDAQSAWFKSIEDIALRLRQKGAELSAQFDLSATPKHNNGAIFVQT
ncbi:unnamed protein product, partial [Symbiodinium sp. CCMP2456]